MKQEKENRTYNNIRLWLGLIPGIIAILGSLSPFLSILLNPIIYLTVAIAGGGVICYVMLLIGFRKINKNPFIHKKLKILWLIGLYVIPVLYLTIFAIWYFDDDLTEAKVTILIADFAGPQPEKYRVNSNIVDKLDSVIGEYSDINMITLNDSISAKQGSKRAREEGNKHRAQLVIWGWYGVTNDFVILCVHVEYIQRPVYLNVERKERKKTYPISEFDSYGLQIRLSDELSYLALVVAGFARYELEDYEGCLGLLEGALMLPADSESMINRAEVYFRKANAIDFGDLGSQEEILANYDSALALKREHAKAWNNRGGTLTLLGRYDEAINSLDSAQKYGLPDYSIQHSKGIVLLQKGNFEEALSYFDMSLKNDSSYFFTWFFRGVALYKLGRYDDALESFDSILAINPSETGALFNKGSISMILGNYEDAILSYNEALFYDTCMHKAWANRGWCLFLLEGYDEAIISCDKALKCKPNYARALFVKGMVFQELGNYKEADSLFDSAYKSDPALKECVESQFTRTIEEQWLY